jgi:hypothetical protein
MITRSMFAGPQPSPAAFAPRRARVVLARAVRRFASDTQP